MSQPFRLKLCYAFLTGGDAPGFDVSGFQPVKTTYDLYHTE